MSKEKTFETFTVDVSPEMQLYKILQRQSYGIESALAEFVDNSVQSFIDARNQHSTKPDAFSKLKLDINVDSKVGGITISDNAGGIKRKDFQRALRLGQTDGAVHGQQSLSVYGIGMKSSAIWLTNTWSIETSAYGEAERLSAVFDLDRLLQDGSSQLVVEANSADTQSHYTKIEIKNTFRNQSEIDYRDRVLPFLLETFIKFRNLLDLVITYDGLVLGTDKAFMETPGPLHYPAVDVNGEPVDNKPITWKRDVNLDFGGKKVTGFMMIMEKGSYKQPGIRLFRNNRVIEGTKINPNIPAIILGTSNKYAAQRIYGELHLDEFPVNFMKTGFDFDLEDLYRTLRSVLEKSEDHPDYVAQATNYRAKKKKKVVENTEKDTDVASGHATGNDSHGTGSAQSENAQSDKQNPYMSQQQDETPITQIGLDKNLHLKFGKLSNKKMQRLYKSVATVSLIEHPVLAYVGCWSLLDSLSNYMGKSESQSFEAFMKNRIDNLSVDKQQRKKYREQIADIHSKGNSNKHDNEWYSVDAKQLHVNFSVLTPFLIKCVDDVLLKSDAKGEK